MAGPSYRAPAGERRASYLCDKGPRSTRQEESKSKVSGERGGRFGSTLGRTLPGLNIKGFRLSVPPQVFNFKRHLSKIYRSGGQIGDFATSLFSYV